MDRASESLKCDVEPACRATVLGGASLARSERGPPDPGDNRHVLDEFVHLSKSVFAQAPCALTLARLARSTPIRPEESRGLILPTLGFKLMRTARATIAGFEVMLMFRKGYFRF